MVLHTLPLSKENTRSFGQIQLDYKYKHGPSTGGTHRQAALVDTRLPSHVSEERCVALPPRLLGDRVHRPASCIPIGYQEKHFQQPLKPSPALKMGGGEGDAYPVRKTTRTILSICGQTNIRVYSRFALCFPLPNGSETRPRIDAHLRKALDILAKSRPEFAGQLELAANVQDQQRTPKSGYICLKQSPSFNIPLKSYDLSNTFGWSFQKLREEGFPAKAFVHPRFDIPCDVIEDGELPVIQIRALYIEGGLVLGVWLHHALADGAGVADFLETFAAATRGDNVGVPQRLDLDLMDYQEDIKRLAGKKTFKELIDECVEYGIHPQLSNPTGAIESPGGTPVPDIEKTGKIFVFSKKKLTEIKNAVNQHLRSSSSDPKRGDASCYTCLAALTWAHVAKARLEVERFAPPTSCPDMAKTARLMNPVSWKRRALKDAAKDYYGNATALAITQIPVSVLMEACDDKNTEALARVVGEIRRAINDIDDEFICRRLATYYAAPDPRYLGLNIDPRTQQDLGFNTWIEIGSDTEWSFPGMKVMKPESVRRTQGGWNMAGSLILPGRKDSDVWELVVTLPKVAMDQLLRDQGYTSKAIRVVD